MDDLQNESSSNDDASRQAGLLERVHEMLQEIRGSGLGAALEQAHNDMVASRPGPFTHPDVDRHNAELLRRLGDDPFALSRYASAPQQAPAVTAPGTLVLYPIPALRYVLLFQEDKKGALLTQAEVEDLAEHCACRALPLEVTRTLTRDRRFTDIRRDHAWADWQAYLAAFRPA